MAKIVPLFSGSKGNSYYIGSGAGGVLVDAGRSCKQIENALANNDIDIKKIRGVFITHEHKDHCSGLRVLVKKNNIPVYATKGTMEGLIKGKCLESNAVTNIINGQVALDDMLIEAFPTMHDANEPCCYKVTTPDDRKAMIATDLGVMTDVIRDAFYGVDALVLESNHDVDMLKKGIYPYYLKERILSKYGHLSNKSCATELPDIIKNGTMRVMLGHLSQENNMPSLAINESVDYLSSMGYKRDYDYTLDVAPVETNGKVILF